MVGTVIIDKDQGQMNHTGQSEVTSSRGTTIPEVSSMPNATIMSQTAGASTTTLSPAIKAVASAAVHGSVVDTIDTTPAMYVAPSALPERAVGTLVVDGDYSLPSYGSLGGSELLFYRVSYLNITDKGYFQIRWEVAWFNTYGLIVLPT